MDREDGRQNGFRRPRWQGSSHGRRRLIWILAAWARRRTRSPFPQLPALTSAATGAAQSLLEARNSLSGRQAVLLKEQLLLPGLCVSGYSRRAVHGSVRRDASAQRVGAEKSLAIPEPACGRRIWFAQPRRIPLPGAPKMSGDIWPPRAPMGTEPLVGSAGAEDAQRADRGDTHTQRFLPSF